MQVELVPCTNSENTFKIVQPAAAAVGSGCAVRSDCSCRQPAVNLPSVCPQSAVRILPSDGTVPSSCSSSLVSGAKRLSINPNLGKGL